MPSDVAGYVQGGSGGERTVAANVAAFERWRLRPRHLRTAPRDLELRLLETVVGHPVALAPTGFQGTVHPEGELATARAAERADALMILSSASSTTLEAVAEEAPRGKRWFQLGMFRERPLRQALAARAQAAGYEALVLMVDTPMVGTRWREIESGYEVPTQWPNLDEWLSENASSTVTRNSKSTVAQHVTELWDSDARWEDIAEIADGSDLPIVVKGVLTADDATQAFEHGAHAVIVSNHGGRQLDGAVASLDALPDIRAAHPTKTILIDGGIRSGLDVLRALALGADAVCIGRPYLWGLSVSGEDGVRAVLGQIVHELDQAMGLSGLKRLSEASHELLSPTDAVSIEIMKSLDNRKVDS